MMLLWWVITGFDYDELLMVCMGFAAAAYVLVDYRRERKLDAIAIEHAERLTALEANNDDSIALEGRLRTVEIRTERDERIEERIAAYAERVAVLETQMAELEVPEEKSR